jgi:hypothetical protein
VLLVLCIAKSGSRTSIFARVLLGIFQAPKFARDRHTIPANGLRPSISIKLEDKKQVNKIFSNLLPTVGLSCAFLAMTSIASASILGGGTLNLSVANCSGGGAEVTATTITFLPAGTAANTGCIDTGVGTGINYTGGSLGANVIGNIMDLTAGTLPVDDFMTFSGTPLDFVLTGIGPGSTNTNCALSMTNPTCSVAPGSPFILTYVSPTATGIALGVNGTLNDGALGGASALWSGSFTTQLNESGTQIQTTELTGGTIGSTQSGNFAVTVVSSTPEPSSAVMLLMGGGLIAVAWRRQRQPR